MARELYLSGFLLTREDWDLLDVDTRALFTKMLADEGRKPVFEEAPPLRRQYIELDLGADVA